MLRKVQLPLARPSILLGVNQTIMMVLSVVIIAGLIGGGGLGLEVIRGLSHERDRRAGWTAGICILLLAIVIDRITQAMGTRTARCAVPSVRRMGSAIRARRCCRSRRPGNEPARRGRGKHEEPRRWVLVASLAVVATARGGVQRRERRRLGRVDGRIGAGGAGRCPTTAARRSTSRSARGSGSAANANVRQVLLEQKLGYTVELTEIDEYAQFPALANGDLDATLEVWPSGHAKDYKKYIDGEQRRRGRRLSWAWSGRSGGGSRPTWSTETRTSPRGKG